MTVKFAIELNLETNPPVEFITDAINHFNRYVVETWDDNNMMYPQSFLTPTGIEITYGVK